MVDRLALAREPGTRRAGALSPQATVPEYRCLAMSQYILVLKKKKRDCTTVGSLAAQWDVGAQRQCKYSMSWQWP